VRTLILHRLKSAIDRIGRKMLNENFDRIEETYKKVIDDSSEAKTTAVEAKEIAQGIDGKATNALNTANQANEKSTNAINIATQKGNEAVNIANQANDTSNYVQQQLDTVILESGDANPEVIQARADFANLRARLDGEKAQFTTQLADITTLTTDNVAAINEVKTQASDAQTKANSPLNQIADNTIPSSKLKQATDADKIKLANLAQEVRDAIAGTTTIGTTPAPGSVTANELANATITRAKLGNVFGYNGVQTSPNYNDLSKEGSYLISGTPINAPNWITGNAHLLVNNHGSYTVQKLVSAENAELSAMRIIRPSNGVYFDWVNTNKDWTPSNNSIARAKLTKTFAYNGNVSSGDYNTLVDDGNYLISGTLSNAPNWITGNANLKVSNHGTFIIQELTGLTNVNLRASRIIRPSVNTYYDWINNGNTLLTSKRIAIFGDSIIEFNTVPEQVEKYLSATVYDCSVGGTRMAQYADDSDIAIAYNKLCMFNLAKAVATRNFADVNQAVSDLITLRNDDNSVNMSTLATTNFSTIDVIVLAFGTNDYAGNNPIGNDNDNTSDGSTFKGSINYIVQTLQTAYPNLQIVFSTPIYRTRYSVVGDGLNSDIHPNSLGLYLKDYADAIKQVATLNHIPVIDLYNESGINQYTSSLYHHVDDGVHPSQQGYDLISRKLSIGLKRYFG